MPLRIPSELIGDLNQGFHCSRRVLREIVKRINKDDDFRRAWREDVTGDFFKDLTDNLTREANNLLYIFGIGGSGKSIVGLTINLYQEEVFRKMGKKVLKGFCRNYGRANIIKAEIQKKGCKAIIQLDEDVRQIGYEAGVVEDNFFNSLDTMRIEQTCITICSPKHRKDILIPNIQRWFGCLEVLMNNFDKHENLCIWYSREGPEGKVYVPVYPNHWLWKWIEAWKSGEQAKQTAALGASAAETWPLRELAEDILKKTMNEFPSANNLKPKDFETIAELMREEDNMVLSTHKTQMACQLAFRIYEPHGKRGTPETSKPMVPLETPPQILANSGEIESHMNYTDFRSWIIEYMKQNKFDNTDISVADYLLQGLKNETIAENLDTYSMDISRRVDTLTESVLGDLYESWYRLKHGDNRILKHGHNEVDCFNNGEIISIKIFTGKRKRMEYHPENDCGPEIKFCEENKLSKFIFHAYCPRWHKQTHDREINLPLNEEDKRIILKDEKEVKPLTSLKPSYNLPPPEEAEKNENENHISAEKAPTLQAASTKSSCATSDTPHDTPHGGEGCNNE